MSLENWIMEHQANVVIFLALVLMLVVIFLYNSEDTNANAITSDDITSDDITNTEFTYFKKAIAADLQCADKDNYPTIVQTACATRALARMKWNEMYGSKTEVKE